jgi:hypothetical protein
VSAARSSALSRLRDGLVTIRHAEILEGRGPTAAPTVIVAAVASSRGDAPAHRVDLHNGAWTCTCDNTLTCPHIAAVMLVTGHGGPASKDTR